MEDLSLEKLDTVRLAIETATNYQEVKDRLDMLEAAKVYARQKQVGEDLRLRIEEYVVRAERKLGEMLKAAKATGEITHDHGNPKYQNKVVPNENNLPKTKLSDTGISRKLSSRAQKLADVPKEEFEQRISEQKKEGKVSSKKTIHAKNGQKKSGEPKSRAPVKPHYNEAEFEALYDQGLNNAEIAKRTGFSKRIVDDTIEHIRIRHKASEDAAQPIITPDMLKLSDNKKVALAIQQETEKIRREYEQKFQERVRSYLEIKSIEIQAQLDKSEMILRRRIGIMSKKTFQLIRSCLHADWVTDPKQKSRYDSAFIEFNKLEVYLLKEEDMSKKTDFVSSLPKTMAEWDEAKRKATEARKAARAKAKDAGTNVVKS